MATHAKPYPVKVDTLRQLSGSRAKALRNFRAQLRLALDDLVANEDIVDWRIEMPDDLVFVEPREGSEQKSAAALGPD